MSSAVALWAALVKTGEQNLTMERFDGPAYRHLAHFATLAKRTYGSMDLFFSVSLDRRRAGRGDFRDLEALRANSNCKKRCQIRAREP